MLLIGHNPALENLTAEFADGTPSAFRQLATKFPTCALVTIKFTFEDWAVLDHKRDGSSASPFRMHSIDGLTTRLRIANLPYLRITFTAIPVLFVLKVVVVTFLQFLLSNIIHIIMREGTSRKSPRRFDREFSLELFNRIPATSYLAITGMILAMMIAIPLDTLMVRLGNTFIDNGAQKGFDPEVPRGRYSEIIILATTRLPNVVGIHGPAGEHTGKYCLANSARNHDRILSGPLHNPPNAFQRAGLGEQGIHRYDAFACLPERKVTSNTFFQRNNPHAYDRGLPSPVGRRVVLDRYSPGRSVVSSMRRLFSGNTQCFSRTS